MTPQKARITRLALDALYYSAFFRVLEPVWGGAGVIFTLHHVVNDDRSAPFSPNRILNINAAFLEQTILQVRAAGCDIVDLDEARRRLVEKDFRRRFVCFTLDDGYLDNSTIAYPVFKKHAAPFTIYVTTGIPEYSAVLWWEHLEQVIAQNEQFEVTLAGRSFNFATSGVADKYRAFNTVYWFLRGLPQERQQAAIKQLILQFSLNPAKLCEQSAMSWEMLREMATDELVSIGAHTINHFALSKLAPEEVRDEVNQSRSIIAEKLGMQENEVRHFTYPFGDAGSAGPREFSLLHELGFATSTTTRKGVVFPEHKDHLQALPRVSLNGDYQRDRYIRLYLSGAPFALWRKFQRLDIG